MEGEEEKENPSILFEALGEWKWKHIDGVHAIVTPYNPQRNKNPRRKKKS